MMDEARRKNVLVIDDDKAQRDLLQRILGIFEMNVRLAESGSDGLQILKEWVPDLILLDIQMPDMDGYETVRQIQELLGKDVPSVVGLSGAAGRGDEAERGFSDFITKPFNLAELRRRLEPFVDLPPC